MSKKYVIIGIAILLAFVGFGLCLEGFQNALTPYAERWQGRAGFNALCASVLLFFLGALTND